MNKKKNRKRHIYSCRVKTFFVFYTHSFLKSDSYQKLVSFYYATMLHLFLKNYTFSHTHTHTHFTYLKRTREIVTDLVYVVLFVYSFWIIFLSVSQLSENEILCSIFQCSCNKRPGCVIFPLWHHVTSRNLSQRCDSPRPSSTRLIFSWPKFVQIQRVRSRSTWRGPCAGKEGNLAFIPPSWNPIVLTEKNEPLSTEVFLKWRRSGNWMEGRGVLNSTPKK